VTGGLPTTAGVTAASSALEPSWVRHGSTQTQQDYKVALAFETVLVEQLTRSMSEAGGLEGESSQEGSEGSPGGAGASGGLGPLSAMLPQALSSGVENGGGLGLAAELTRSQMAIQHGSHSSPAAAPTGGTPS